MVSLSFLFISAAFAAPALTLSQKDVAELVLKQGPASKDVTYKYEQTRYDVLIKNLTYLDWQMQIETGYQSSRTESLTNYLNSSKTENAITTVTVRKSLLTGTLVQLDLGRNSQKSDSLTSTTPNDAVQDSYQLSLEQALWGNFLGVADRANNAAADASYRQNISLRANELETVVLNTLQLYWTAYVAQENFRESLAARERSSKLVASVKRRSASSYANPGELSQAQGDLEIRERNVKANSVSYLAKLEDLLRALSIDPATEVLFAVPQELPPVPKLEPHAIDSLRSVRSAEYGVKAAEEVLTSTESLSHPRLSLVGRLRATGVDETTDASYAELSSGSHPETYIGVRLAYTFGSGAQSEELRARRATLARAQAALELQKAFERDQAATTEREVGALYSMAQSALRERGYREKAMNELNRTYSQGRTTLKDLIDAMNKYFDTQTLVMQSLGDYHIALNRWAALRDELIPDLPDQKEGTP